MASVFAKNLRFLREEIDISQTDMGERLGLTRASVDAYEDGRAMPPYPKLKRIADHFNLSVEAMTEEELWGSPLEKEIERLKQIEEEDEKDIILREEGSDATLEEQLHSLNISLTDSGESKHGLPLIPLVELKYFAKYLNSSWASLEPQLKKVSFDLPKGKNYRAFESGQDFPFSKSVLFVSPIENFSDLEDGDRYLVVSKTHGILYRTVFSQIERKGTIILSAEVGDIDTIEIPVSEIKELWEVKAFFSKTLPKPTKDLSALSDLVEKLQAELKRLG
ncbi:helix-turn-helix transcriptional regulator [uncultured Arcticibacterium sp.]|uniref:helix-turn-helix transcriptional regulator n=1 Tax=uncultured Arcticibacterium sp. TaxID=2173042 RepID=UPI0030F55D7B